MFAVIPHETNMIDLFECLKDIKFVFRERHASTEFKYLVFFYLPLCFVQCLYVNKQNISRPPPFSSIKLCRTGL